MTPADDLITYANSKPFPDAESALEALSKGNEDWINTACEIAARICTREGEFTTDDLWRECPPPPGVKGQIFGAVTRKLVKAKKLEPTGNYRPSVRAECHKRPIAIYRPGAASRPRSVEHFPLTDDPTMGAI